MLNVVLDNITIEVHPAITAENIKANFRILWKEFSNCKFEMSNFMITSKKLNAH